MLFWPHAKQPERPRLAAFFLMRYLIYHVSCCGSCCGPRCGGGGGGGDVPSGASRWSAARRSRRRSSTPCSRRRRELQDAEAAFRSPARRSTQTLKNQAVQYLVQRAEFEQEAEKLGVKVTDKEVDDRLDEDQEAVLRRQREATGSSSSSRASPTSRSARTSGRSSSPRRSSRRSRGVKVSDADVQKYYDEHQSQYGAPEQRDVAPHPRKKKALADKLYERSRRARTSPSSPSSTRRIRARRRSGGKLTISKGQTVGAVRPDRVPAQDGRVSQPVKTEFGYHIIKALGPVKAAKTTPFTKVKASIRQQLEQQKKNDAMTTWSTTLKKKYCTDEDLVPDRATHRRRRPAAATTTTPS